MVGMGLSVLDYDLVRVFRPIIKDGLAEFGITAKVLQNYQPTNQGIKDNVVYFHNIGDEFIGYQSKENKWNKTTGKMESVEGQNVATTFQINTILAQNPANLNLTAKDLLTYVSMILQRRDNISKLNQSGIGILWIGAIKNIPFVNGEDSFEYNPTMDIKFTHKNVFKKNGEVIEKINFNFNRL